MKIYQLVLSLLPSFASYWSVIAQCLWKLYDRSSYKVFLDYIILIGSLLSTSPSNNCNRFLSHDFPLKSYIESFSSYCIYPWVPMNSMFITISTTLLGAETRPLNLGILRWVTEPLKNGHHLCHLHCLGRQVTGHSMLSADQKYPGGVWRGLPDDGL